MEFWNGKHEKEIKVQFMELPEDGNWAKMIQREEWIPIGSTDLCPIDCNNKEHGHRITTWQCNGESQEVDASVFEQRTRRFYSGDYVYDDWKGMIWKKYIVSSCGYQST